MPRSAASTRLVTRDMSKSGSFDGTSTYCTVPITPSTTAFSVAFWVKLGNGNASNARILDWQDSGPLNGFTFNLGISGSRLSFAPVFGDGTGNIGTFNVYTAVPGDWSHHVLTYTANNMKWYVNGTLFGTDTSGTMTAAATTLTIGRRAPSAGNFFKGLIDGFVFLNGRAMTSDEVTTLYTAGVHPSDTSCHIRFNDNVTDETSNGNNLTAFNLTYSTDVALKTRSTSTIPRRSVENLVFNGDFEYAPSFTAATNTANRYIDGTASGLNTFESAYKWFTPSTFANATAQYDTSVKLTGTASMKLSTTTTAGLASAIIGNNTSAANIKLTMIPVLPSTSYTVSGYCKTSNVAAAAAHIDIYEYNGTGTIGATNTTNTLTGTNDWTKLTATFTTASTARFITLALRNHVAGNVSDAWFDDIRLTKTTPDTRLSA
jgi:hypothetical protein